MLEIIKIKTQDLGLTQNDVQMIQKCEWNISDAVSTDMFQYIALNITQNQ